MSVRVTYPNEGLYDGGQPRFEIVNAKGEITSCRTATPEEALIFAHTEAMDNLRDSLERFSQQVHDVQCYGLRVSK